MFGRDKNKSSGAPAVNPSMQPARSVSFQKNELGTPAVSMRKVEATAGVSFAKKAQVAGISLKKRGLLGVRAQVRLYLDYSQSMEWRGRKYYSSADKPMQTMVDRVLAFGLQVDVDGSIPVIGFDSRLHRPIDVTLDNYEGVVDRHIWRGEDTMGGTNYDLVLDDILAAAEVTDVPILAIIGTDGDPNNQASATKRVKNLSRYPGLLKFVAFEEVPYLEYLDNLEDHEPGGRLIDNVDAKFFNGQRDADTGIVMPKIRDITDEQLADALADEWDTWFAAAGAAGIVTGV